MEGRALGRRHNLAPSPRKGSLDTAIKKISDVWIFLRLCNSQLSPSSRAYDFAQNVSEILRPENIWRRIRHVILRQSDEMDLRPNLAVKGVKCFQEKSLRKLTRPIGSEIEKQNTIAVMHALFIRKS